MNYGDGISIVGKNQHNITDYEYQVNNKLKITFKITIGHLKNNISSMKIPIYAKARTTSTLYYPSIV